MGRRPPACTDRHCQPCSPRPCNCVLRNSAGSDFSRFSRGFLNPSAGKAACPLAAGPAADSYLRPGKDPGHLYPHPSQFLTPPYLQHLPALMQAALARFWHSCARLVFSGGRYLQDRKRRQSVAGAAACPEPFGCLRENICHDSTGTPDSGSCGEASQREPHPAVPPPGSRGRPPSGCVSLARVWRDSRASRATALTAALSCGTRLVDVGFFSPIEQRQTTTSVSLSPPVGCSRQ